MKQPHKHAAILRAIADGEEIQINYSGTWQSHDSYGALLEIGMHESNDIDWRIKPLEEKQDETIT